MCTQADPIAVVEEGVSAADVAATFRDCSIDPPDEVVAEDSLTEGLLLLGCGIDAFPDCLVTGVLLHAVAGYRSEYEVFSTLEVTGTPVETAVDASAEADRDT